MELSLAKAVFFFGDPISGSNEVVGSKLPSNGISVCLFRFFF